jgi:hypothetical protein
VADAGVTVDTALAAVAFALAGMSIPPPGFLTMLRAMTGNPALPELGIRSPTLAATAAAEPVPGVSYHTFGGTSPAFARLWAKVFTPDSTVPIPIPIVPFPLFHWGTAPGRSGRRST